MIKLVKEKKFERINVELLDDIDLFVDSGNKQLIEIAFHKYAYINLRSLLRFTNSYEFLRENPIVNLEFLIRHKKNYEIFDFIFTNIIHNISITNIQDIMSGKSQLQLVVKLLENQFFQSMFISSLEC